MQIHTRRGGGLGHQRLVMEEQDQGGPLPELIANRPLVNDFLRLLWFSENGHLDKGDKRDTGGVPR